jgi:hypothetical protein
MLSSEFWATSGPAIRQAYHKWDSGNSQNDVLFDTLREIGLELDISFVRMIEQHKRTRDLPFAAFIKLLKQVNAPSGPESADGKRRPDAVRVMRAVNLREIPVPSSARAPFGTDNNIYITGAPQATEKDPVLSSIIHATMDSAKKHYGQVPGALDLFKESPDESNVPASAEVPKLLKSSMNPFTGEPLFAEAEAEVSPPSTPRRQENILTWDGNDAPLLTNNKKHFQVPSRIELDWPAPPTVAPVPSVRPPSRNILTQEGMGKGEGFLRVVVRRGESRPTDRVPYATE